MNAVLFTVLVRACKGELKEKQYEIVALKQNILVVFFFQILFLLIVVVSVVVCFMQTLTLIVRMTHWILAFLSFLCAAFIFVFVFVCVCV